MFVTMKKRPVDFRKNVYVLVFLLHTFWDLTPVTEAASLDENCAVTDFSQPPQKFNFCFNTTSTAITMFKKPVSFCTKPYEILNISNFFLYSPEPNEIDKCSIGSINSVKYNQYRASCLQSKKPSEIKKIILPIMRMFSAKSNSDVSNTKIVNYPRETSGLVRNFTWLSFDYMCSERNVTNRIYHLDMCDNITGHGIEASYNAHIDFSSSTYNKSFGSHTCSCYIKSTHNESKAIKIRAIDVRLQSNLQLKLKENDGDESTLDSSTLYWWQDGYLLETEGEALIELSQLSLSKQPDSVWLQIFGRNLTIVCGAKNLDKAIATLNGPNDDDESLGIGYIIFIVVGVIAVVVFLLFVGRKIHRRMKEDDSDTYEFDDLAMDPVPSREVTTAEKSEIKEETVPKEEVTYSIPHKPAHNAKESEKPLLPNPQEYMLLENEYEEAGPSHRNKENPSGVTPYSLAKQPSEGASCSNDNNNIYNHLREKPDVVPTGNLYDVSVGSEYSTCQRKPAPAVIANIYD